MNGIPTLAVTVLPIEYVLYGLLSSIVEEQPLMMLMASIQVTILRMGFMILSLLYNVGVTIFD